MMALIFAILIAVGGAYVVRQYLTQEEEVVEPLQPSPPPVVVPTAGYDIPADRLITRNDIVPLRFASEAEFRKSKYARMTPFVSRVTDIVGRRLKQPVDKGGVFKPDGFYPDGKRPSIVDKLPPNTLAFALPVTSSLEILQWIEPGDPVNVYFRASAPAPSQTFLLLQNAVVSAVGNEQPEVPARTVTIQVTEYQARWLANVIGKGDISLSPANPKYAAAAEGPGAAGSLSIGNLVRMPVGVRAKGMAVYMGTKRSTMVFDQQTVYNDPLLVPTPIPRFAPAGANSPESKSNEKK